MNQVSKANELWATTLVYLSPFYSRTSNECLVNILPALPFDSWSFTIQMGGGHAVAQLVETLRYKPEGRGFDSRWCY